MRNRLRRWLNSIPIHDPIEHRIALLVQVVLLGLSGVLLFAALLTLVAYPFTTGAMAAANLQSSIKNFQGVLLVIAPLVLLRRGYFRVAVAILMLELFLLAFTTFYSVGLEQGWLGAFVLALPISLAALALGRRWSLAIYVASIAAVAVTAFAWYPLADPSTNAPSVLISFALLAGLLVLFLDRFGTIFRQSLTALRDSETSFRLLFANNPLPMWVYDAQTLAFVEANQAAILHYDYTHTEFLQMRMNDIYQPENLPALTEDMNAERQAQQVSGPRRHRLKNGRIIDVIIHAHSLEFAGRQAVLVVAEDITERKQVEAERDRFFALSIDMLTIVGVDGHLKRVNPACKRILGHSETEMLAEPLLSFVHPEDRAATGVHFAQLAGGVPGLRLENRVCHKDGSYRWMAWTLAHAPGEGLIYAVGRDITEEKEAAQALLEAHAVLEQRVRERTTELATANVELRLEIDERQRIEVALRQAQAEAEAANQAKSDFLSRMSHELRTPMNAILGFAQLLEFGELNADQRESVNHILNGGNHLLELINEVLDIARIEARRLPISIEPVALGEVCREVLDLIAPLATARDIQLIRPDTGDNRYVLADRQRLKQVLLNLLSNAIKYNRPGGRVTLAFDAGAADHLRLVVQDTGYGITPADLDRLFMPFERLHADQHGVEGTGLGLVLSKGLIEAMGGSIGIESVPGTGSTFWIELPIAAGTSEQVARPSELALAGEAGVAAAEPTRTVLYIEDNLSNVKLVERVLEQHPHIRLLTAMQGRLGLDLAREHQPDLILLDLHLPDLSGLEVLRHLKGDPGTLKIPVVMLSADAMERQIERLLAAGAQAYLSKPLNIRQFLATVDEILNDRTR